MIKKKSNNFFDGVKFALGILLVFSIFSAVFAVGFHSANEILNGTFLGDYKFIGNVQYNGTLNVTEATLIGNFGGGIEKSNTSICNLGSEGDMRYNPTTKSYEGCYDDAWRNIKKVGCDYVINGNCWNIVWKAPINNIFSTKYVYDDPVSVLKGTAFAFGYINSGGTLSQTYYTEDGTVVSMLRTKHPLEYIDINTNVNMLEINTDTVSNGLFKCGTHSFGSYCSDASNTASTYGRVCFTGNNNFPYYNSFSIGSGDYCTNSNLAYNTATCTDEKRFVILARIS